MIKVKNFYDHCYLLKRFVHSPAKTLAETNFKLLGVAALLQKAHDGIFLEELYNDAERKFDTLVGLLNDEYEDNVVLRENGYVLSDLKRLSFLVFDRLILDRDTTPYMTLCVSDDANADEIKRRRNKLLQIFHPDSNSGEYADEEKTRMITESYEKIISSCRREDSPFTRWQSNSTPVYRYRKRRNNITVYTVSVGLLIILGFLIFYLMF